MSNALVNIIAVIICLSAVAVILVATRTQDMVKVLTEIRERKNKAINLDSLQSAIEDRILDSVQVKLEKRDAEISKLKKDIASQRRKNEALENLLNSLRSAPMPEF